MEDIENRLSKNFFYQIYELIYIQNAIHIAKINFNLNQKLLKISENSYADDKALFYELQRPRPRIFLSGKSFMNLKRSINYHGTTRKIFSLQMRKYKKQMK